MATKAFGWNYDKSLVGWAKVSETAQPSGEATIVFRGILSSLSSALTAIANDDKLIYDAVSVDTDEESGTATITLTKSATTTESKPSTGQTRLPTVAIQGSMLSPQLHQHPTFSTGEKPLTLSAIATTNYCLKNYGEVATGDLHGEEEIAFTYARWRSYGIDTYLAPSYTMTITYYLDKTSKIDDFILEAGKVFKFSSAISRLPNDIKPTDIGVPAWLAQAPSINITSDGITVSQAFVGAKAFPSFYASEDKSLTYDAPDLPDIYWRDLKHKREHSGEES
jgi:hypothetical protein